VNARRGSAASTDSGPPTARATNLPPPAERGATVIPDKVVARIAAQAARTAQARRAAVPPDRGRSSVPSASAASHTGSVRLHLTLDMPYPADIPHLCERIQHDTSERVAQLTGLHVREVTVTVRRLVTASGVSRGRVQ